MSSEFEPVPAKYNFKCPHCKSPKILYRDYGNGDYEDYAYRCQNCGKYWISEGSDS